MRTVLLGVLVIPLVAATAEARPRGGGSGGGGGGRLGQVTGGISTATGAGEGGGGGASACADTRRGDDACDATREGELYRRVRRDDHTLVVASDGTIVRRIDHALFDGGTANVDLFVGVQDVFDSNAALSLALSFDDRWFRLAVGLTHYWEDQMDGSELTLSIPTLMGGVRIDDRGATKAFVEAGVAVAKTANEPMGDASITGPVAGLHVEHRLGRPTVVGDAHAMFFEDGVRAYRARLGVRISRFEAAFSVLDFNVGPSLYGPELGLAF